MHSVQQDPNNQESRDRLSLVDFIGEIPWPDTWCSESLMDRIARSQKQSDQPQD